MLNGKLLSNAFPINKVEVFFDNLDHSDFLGFKWEMVGEGRAPVGLDINDSDFNEIGKLIGEKTHTLTVDEMPSHTHDVITLASYESGSDWVGAAGTSKARKGNDGALSTGGSQAHNNVQPSIVMAFWKRVA